IAARGWTPPTTLPLATLPTPSSGASIAPPMNRRAFVTGLGAVLAAPRAAGAQQAGEVYKVGTLSICAPASLEQQTDWWSPFMEAMRELNYVEGRNLLVKRASAAGRGERLPALARDLVRANVDIIVTTSTRETRAAKDATSAISIVMTFAPDP